MKSLVLILSLLWAASAQAFVAYQAPASGADAFAASGTGYVAKIEDCQLVAPYSVEVDALSLSGNSVQRSGTLNNGEFRCQGTATGDFHVWMAYRSDVVQAGGWLDDAPLGPRNIHVPNGFALNSQATFGWQKVCSVGSNENFANGTNADCDRTFTFAGAFSLYGRGRRGVVAGAIYIDTDPNASPPNDWEPDGPSSPTATYALLETLNNITTIDHPDILAANAVSPNNSANNNTDTNTVRCVRNDSLNRMFCQLDSSDPTPISVMASDDASFSTQEDHLDIRLRPASLNQLADADLHQITANWAGFCLDADFTGGTRTVAKDLNCTVTVGSGKLLVAFDFDVADGSQTLFNLNVRDKETGVSATHAHHSGTTTNAQANLGEYGILVALPDAVPGSADTTDPTVGTPTVVTTGTEAITLQSTVTDNASTSFNARIGFSTVEGGPYTYRGWGACAASPCQRQATGLPTGTVYFVFEAQDEAGNIGTSAEISETIPGTSSPANKFANTTAQGTGDCSSEANAGLLLTCVRTLVAGDILEVADGTYTGTNGTIIPNSGQNGTASAKITVRAETDGGVFLNGQGTGGVRIRLENNDHWIIEGINAANSTGDVIALQPGTDHTTLRRVVAWNANATTNNHVFMIRGTNNVLEDIGCFGTGRKCIQYYSTAGPVTIRRVWARWEYSTRSDPKMPITGLYGSYQATLENVLATWAVQPGANTSQRLGAISIGDGLFLGANMCANTRVLGSIAYTPSGVTMDQGFFLFSTQYADCIEWRNVVAYALNHPLRMTVNFDNQSTQAGYERPPGAYRIYSNGTEFGSVYDLQSQWATTNRCLSATLGGCPSIWNGAGSSGARVCYRYVDGALTSTPLWPWPMNQRIIDAMKIAGKTPVDVTATMETLFGTIPAECRSS